MKLYFTLAAIAVAAFASATYGAARLAVFIALSTPAALLTAPPAVAEPSRLEMFSRSAKPLAPAPRAHIFDALRLHILIINSIAGPAPKPPTVNYCPLANVVCRA